MEVESILLNIKSNFIIKKIFAYMDKPKLMKIINHNKILQKRLNLSLEKYKEYFEILSPIIIEINIAENNHDLFINAHKDYFHAYFDDNKKEIKRNRINEWENVKKIKVIINYQIKSSLLLVSLKDVDVLNRLISKNLIELILLIWKICSINVHH